MLKKEDIMPDVEIMPLIIISAESLEASEELIPKLNEALKEYLDKHAKLYWGFSLYVRDKYQLNQSIGSKWINDEYEKFTEEMKLTLSPH
jgi:hypothetical protein